MTIQISRKCEYALKAMVYIAGLGKGDLYNAKSISTSEGIPLKFLEKILQSLVSGGLLQVTYGPRGGYKLARLASDISFRDVIEAVEGPMRLNLCVGNDPECVGQDCSMRNYWKQFQGKLEDMFENTNLAEAAGAVLKARAG